MTEEERDPVSGQPTTGHEWNGIKELDTPVPRGVLIFLVVTHVFAVAWWFLMPTWPLGVTYTKGLLGIDQRQTVNEQVVEAANQRAAWMGRIETASYSEIKADEELMSKVTSTGRQLFGDNCAACHGIDGKGRANYPNLIDDDWLWGGSAETIADTMRVGINTEHPDSRFAEMPSFGRDQMLDRQQVSDVAAYVYSLSNPDYASAQNAERITAGQEVFATNCSACHGEDAGGDQELGAPNLSDAYWLYGGNIQEIVTSVHGGRRGHMPTWDERLTESEIKILALYVNQLRVANP